MIIKAIISSMNQIEMLKRQVERLRADPLISEIIVVEQATKDGTRGWLRSQDGIISICQDVAVAGVARNAGLDAAGEFDFVLMLDGGVLPLHNSVGSMLDYLNAHQGVDVISPEVLGGVFVSIEDEADRRMGPIDESTCFPQRAISSTAYALCRARAWDGIRFSVDGPFGKEGWGVDDNDMAYRWNDAGIVNHNFNGVKVYKAPGTLGEIQSKTGLHRAGYGSVYEERLVKLQQDWPQYEDRQWRVNRIDVSCVILGWNEYPMFARSIKRLHKDLAEIPHEIIFVDNGSTDNTRWWLDTFALRWPHGDTVIDAETGEIVRREEREDLEPIWTGNVIRVDLPENMGAGRGYNEGFKRARGKYIFYLSGDILPTIGSVEALKRYLDEHEDADYVGVNPWVSQGEDEDPPFSGFDHLPRQGLGNYAGSYAVFRRECLDDGVKLADTGPFEGAGCGYEEAETANLFYSAGRRCFVFNEPHYYHRRRDFKRSGHDENKKAAAFAERKKWLATRWPGQRFDITHHHNQPPERHVRRVAVVYKASKYRPGPGGHMLAALQDICIAEQFEPGSEPEGWDNYLFVDNGDFDHFDCPGHCRPSEFWAIDMMTPQQSWRPSLDGYVRRARSFDRVFAAQLSAVEHFAENGIDAKWLPLAANPEYHICFAHSEKVYDWIALWHNTPDRIEFIKSAHEKGLPDGFVGYRDGREYSEWMSKGACAISISRSNELILRVFEVMAMGVPLVTDRARGIERLFSEGKHYIGFSDPSGLVKAIDLVAKNPKLATDMAMSARELVLSKHTYYHRALEIYGK